jgi:hypothetical protein
MLKATDRCNAVCLDRPTPLEVDEVEYQQVIKPILAIATSEYVHLVVYHACRVELPHWCFPTNNAGDVEGELVCVYCEKFKKYLPTPLRRSMKITSERTEKPFHPP